MAGAQSARDAMVLALPLTSCVDALRPRSRRAPSPTSIARGLHIANCQLASTSPPPIASSSLITFSRTSQ
eukprot:4614637-Heterocapsa_arctica.AAC.1